MHRLTDLHIHSVHSDGAHTPAALVEMAAKKGLQAIALADHDSIDGIEEALAAGQRHGIEIIPAIELSVEFTGFHDIHLLGYCIDYRDESFQERLSLFRKRRDQRVRAIVTKINDRLCKEGKSAISYEEVAALARGVVCRPHIAQVLVGHGIARDIQDAFNCYLVPCNVPKLYFAMEEALAEIRRLQGVSVLAHPMMITDDRVRLRQLIYQLAAMGLDGLEIFTNSCHNQDVEFLESVANHFKLVKTGGSDYHGLEGDVEIGTGRGMLKVPYCLVTSLQQRRIDRSHDDIARCGI